MSLYIRLFHGRDYPEEELDDWGHDGPVLGPFDDMSVTYLSSIRFFEGIHEYWVHVENDLFFYDGKYYGDWSIFPKNTSPKEIDGFTVERPIQSKFDKDTPQYVAERAKRRLIPDN